MGGFPIYFVPQEAVCYPVDGIAQEWNVSFFFFFHCKLYLIVESTEVTQKLVVFLDHGAR